jgi:hypothetical protein
VVELLFELALELALLFELALEPLKRLSAAKAALAKNTAKTITNNFFIFFPFKNFSPNGERLLSQNLET